MSRVDKHFDRIESVIDVAYDIAYGAVDTVFTAVDTLFNVAKNKAQEAQERATGGYLSPREKAYALADYYANTGQPEKAARWKKYADANIVPVEAVTDAWDGVQPPDNAS
jgi:hypothetical protein